MFEFITKIWYMIYLLPVIAIEEGTKKFSDFLKRRNIYSHWDVWHSVLFLLIILLIILLANGF